MTPKTNKKATSEPRVETDWPEIGADSLVLQFGMDERSVALRRQFVRLGEADRVLLSEWVPWAQYVAPHVAHKCCDWQFTFPPTRQFLEEYADRNEIPLPALRQQLEASQTRYLAEVFTGSAVNWDLRYLETRLRIALTHDRMNLPFKWYIGSYTEYRRLFGQYLRREIEDEEKVAQVEESIDKVLNFDMQAIGDVFMLKNIQTMLTPVGIRLEEVCSDGDQAEKLGRIKEAVRMQTDSFLAAMSEMAEEHDKGDIDVRMDADKLRGPFKTMAQGINDLVASHIAVETKAMACLEEFSKGNYDAQLERFPGKRAFINEAVERLRNSNKSFLAEVSLLVNEVGDVLGMVPGVFEQIPGNIDPASREIVRGIYKVKDRVLLVLDTERARELLQERGT